MVRRMLTRLVAMAALVASLAGCWPAPGQGPDRRSHNPFETRIGVDTARDLTELWRGSTGGAGDVGPPVVSGGGVHVTDGTQLVTFTAATGAHRWSIPSEPMPFPVVGAPLVDGDRVLFTWGTTVGFGGAWTGDTAWHDVATGALVEDLGSGVLRSRRGARQIETWAFGSPVAGVSGAVLAMSDLEDPAVRWSTVLSIFDGPAHGSIDGTTLGAEAVYHAGGALASFETPPSLGVWAWSMDAAVCDTLEPAPQFVVRCARWFTPTEGAPVGGPVVGHGEDAIYVVTDAGELLALATDDGAVLWRAALGGVPSAMPALDDDTLFVALDDGRLVAVPAGGCGAATCPVTWTARTGGAGLQPAVAGGVVVVATDAGTVRAFAADGCRSSHCRALWRADMGVAATGAPAISGGRVFVGTANGGVVAYG